MGLFDFFKRKDKTGSKNEPEKPPIEPNGQGEFNLQLADFSEKVHRSEVVGPIIIAEGTEDKYAAYQKFPPKKPGDIIELKTYIIRVILWEQVVELMFDPDTARQIYERLKVKYHPDRQPDKREYWNNKLRELDEHFNEYMLEIEKRMHASSVPNLPWNKPAELKTIIVDEVLANRLTHCLANNIGSEEQIRLMPDLLKQYPDYRRVVASYLFGVKRNPVLQKLLADDDRPQVGLVVLLQNVQGKSIKERHEVLKSVYRVKEDKIRGFLKDENLDIDRLYEEVPKVAEVAKNPMTGRASNSNTTVQAGDGSIKLTYERDWTWIYGVPQDTPHAQKIRNAGFKWSGKRGAWFADHKVDGKVFD